MNVTEISTNYLSLYKDFIIPAYWQRIKSYRGQNIHAFKADDNSDDTPYGFTLGWGAESNQDFELVSLYVNPLFRKRGVAQTLLGQLEKRFLAKGYRRGVHYFSYRDDDLSYPKFLAKNGWNIAQVRQIICKSTLALADDTPWLKRARLPEGYSIKLWGHLSEEARDQIKARQADEKRLNDGKGWYAEDQNPFSQEHNCHEKTSLAYLKGDTVVGWVITHEPAKIPNSLRWTISFVSPKIQGSARILPLWKEVAMRQKLHTKHLNFIWTVPLEHPRMLRFAKRHMRPWLKEMRYACVAICELEKKN